MSINLSAKKGQAKAPVAEAEIVAGEGLVDDAHRGFAHRQVSLLMIESIEAQCKRLGGAAGIEIGPGAYAENLTTRGLDLAGVAIGDEFVITTGACKSAETAEKTRTPGSGGTKNRVRSIETAAGVPERKGGGAVRLRVTQIGKECHTRCAIFKLAGECIMPGLGIFCEVLSGGTVRTGDRIEKR